MAYSKNYHPAGDISEICATTQALISELEEEMRLLCKLCPMRQEGKCYSDCPARELSDTKGLEVIYGFPQGQRHWRN